MLSVLSVLLVETVLMAQTEVSPWANLTATGIIGALLVWVITKAFPQMLDRHDVVQLEARNHFERVLNNMESGRSASAKEGHDAARLLSSAIDSNAESLRANTKAVDLLTNKVTPK